jgi:hypothetical protein
MNGLFYESMVVTEADTDRASTGFAEATHPVWWIMAGCGTVVTLLSWISNTAWARDSARQVAQLLMAPAGEGEARS